MFCIVLHCYIVWRDVQRSVCWYFGYQGFLSKVKRTYWLEGSFMKSRPQTQRPQETNHYTPTVQWCSRLVVCCPTRILFEAEFHWKYDGYALNDNKTTTNISEQLSREQRFCFSMRSYFQCQLFCVWVACGAEFVEKSERSIAICTTYYCLQWHGVYFPGYDFHCWNSGFLYTSSGFM